MTPEIRTVIELLVVAILMVIAFPFAELIRLNFLTPRFYQDPPRWRLAWRVGGGVLGGVSHILDRLMPLSPEHPA